MRLFILFNSVFHACALNKSYVYFRSIRGAWISRRMHLDPLLGCRIPVRHWIQTALEHCCSPFTHISLSARKSWILDLVLVVVECAPDPPWSPLRGRSRSRHQQPRIQRTHRLSYAVQLYSVRVKDVACGFDGRAVRPVPWAWR